MSIRRGKRVAPGNGRNDLLFLGDLIEAGTMRPVIDRTYDLRQIVEAHRYVDTGRKNGSVVITLGS